MIRELFQFIGRYGTAACAVAVIFFMAGACAGCINSTTPSPTATPTAQAGTPLPTASPTPTPAPTSTPTATPAPEPTVTPDMAITRSISPLDQYAPNYMVHVEKSTDAGLLSVDLANSDTGDQYAYRNDTFTVRLVLADLSNASIDRIKVRVSCVNFTDNGYALHESDRIDYVLLHPGDKITRTVGFKVPSDAPQGLYRFRIDISADLPGNDSWPDFGCSYESGLNILKAPQ